MSILSEHFEKEAGREGGKERSKGNLKPFGSGPPKTIACTSMDSLEMQKSTIPSKKTQRSLGRVYPDPNITNACTRGRSFLPGVLGRKEGISKLRAKRVNSMN